MKHEPVGDLHRFFSWTAATVTLAIQDVFIAAHS